MPDSTARQAPVEPPDMHTISSQVFHLPPGVEYTNFAAQVARAWKVERGKGQVEKM